MSLSLDLKVLELSECLKSQLTVDNNYCGQISPTPTIEMTNHFLPIVSEPRPHVTPLNDVALPTSNDFQCS